MISKIKISSIKGAEYNPRLLSEQAEKDLINSINRFGQIKPIIVRKENMTIVAGHQRTKIMKNIGYDMVDAIFLEDVKLSDEATFNQLHNLCEVEINSLQPIIKIPASIEQGYKVISYNSCNVEKSGQLGQILKVLTGLIIRYNEFGSIIATKSGEVIVSSLYCLACIMTQKNILVYYVEDKDKEEVINTFKKDFGVYNYDNVPKETYVQSWAQMNRLQGDMQLKSRLYENLVMKNISLNQRILDFGAGKMAYVKKLKGQGYKIHGLEFYRKKNNQNVIDYNQVISDFNNIIDDIVKNGLYDVVVCDSVVNSVNSLEAQKSVLITLNLLCKKDGIVFFSGRPVSTINDLKKSTSKTNTMYFKDANNFTANYLKGYWFYQKFHDINQQMELVEYFDETYLKHNKDVTGFRYMVNNSKVYSKEQYHEAIKYELTLPLPNSNNYNLYNENIDFINQIINLKINGN